MNALLHELHRARLVRPATTSRRTPSASMTLQRVVERCPPERAAEICDVAGRATSRAAAELLGTSERLLSTVLQGFYQSQPGHGRRLRRSTTSTCCAACSADRAPACYQMNGQPTAQNTRETGADGDLPGLPQLGQPDAHPASWPSCGTSTRRTIPHWAPPTHAMQILRYAEQGSIELLWITATNPAVSLPGPGAHPRASSQREELFVVVQDLFLTETAELADVVLPAATWGEKTRHLHQRRPHRAPLRAGGRPAGRGPRRPRHLPRLRAADGLPRPRRRPADHVARRRGGVRGLEALLARAGPATTPASATTCCAGAAASSGPAPPTAPEGTERLYTDGVLQHRPRTTARPTART